MDMYAFAPNSASTVDAKYKSPAWHSNVTTTVSVIQKSLPQDAFSGGNFWFMATDKAATDKLYNPAMEQRTYAIISGSRLYYILETIGIVFRLG